LASAVITAASTPGGTAGARAASGRGASPSTRRTTACAVGPANGGSPASAS